MLEKFNIHYYYSLIININKLLEDLRGREEEKQHNNNRIILLLNHE